MKKQELPIIRTHVNHVLDWIERKTPQDKYVEVKKAKHRLEEANFEMAWASKNFEEARRRKEIAMVEQSLALSEMGSIYLIDVSSELEKVILALIESEI